MRAVTVLGSGNAYHEDGRGHAAFAVETDERRLVLVDAGATALLRLREFRLDLAALDAVLVTHFHGDHTLGLPPILLYLKTFCARDRDLAIVGPNGSRDVLGRLIEAAFPGFEPGFGLRFVELADGASLDLGAVRVEAHAVTHRPESLGYRLAGAGGATVAFSGDCAFDDRLVRLVHGVDLAFVEVGLPGGPLPGVHHVALDEIVERGRDLRAARRVFTHLNDGVAATIERLGIGDAARDGLRIDLERPG